MLSAARPCHAERSEASRCRSRQTFAEFTLSAAFGLSEALCDCSKSPSHIILHVDGQSKLANLAPIPCKLLGDSVPLKQPSLHRKAEGDAWTETSSPGADEWASIKQWTLRPEQELYEQIHPIILFGETAGERAKEANAAQRTLSRKADEFERYGMQSLFSEHSPREQAETVRSLPLDMRQLIVDLHAELPTMSWREIAEICYIRSGRKPSHHSVKHIASSGLPPFCTTHWSERNHVPRQEVTHHLMDEWFSWFCFSPSKASDCVAECSYALSSPARLVCATAVPHRQGP